VAVEELILRIIGDSKSGEKALDRVSQRLRNFGAMLTGASDAALVTFAKLGESGAELEALEVKFDRMARAFGKSAGEMLAAWEEASAGTLSRAEMMAKANQAALLGLPVDRLADLLTIARNASEATGESVSYMFDSLVTGIGRQSKMVLDNLGIVFTAEEAYKAYAQSIGKSADALTAQEQQAAFLEATLQAASRQEQVLGKASDNAATRIARAKASLANAKDEIAKAFVPVATRLYEIVGSIAKIFSAIPAPVKEFGAKVAGAGASLGAIVGPLMTFKGMLPMIKTAVAALGGSVGAIAPIIAVVLALIAVVKLAAKAWKENWGGIQNFVQSVVATIKPILDKIVGDVRYWIAEIKKELAGIMAAIRAIIEPALAKLHNLFQDGVGIVEAMTFIRDAVNVILSTIKNLLAALRALLEGNADQAWNPLKDAALNVITLIVLGWRKYISKALTYGWNLVVNLANGIIKAASTVLTKAATYIGNIIGRFLAPGSPPKEGPLRGIVKWGKGLINTYLKSFQLADFDILRDSLSPLRQALQTAVDLGDIDQSSMLSLFRSVRTQVAGLIAEFRETGQINEEVMGRISGQLGEAGQDYMEYLRLTLEHQKALENLKSIQEEVEEAEKKGFVPAELEERLRAAEEEAAATEEAANWQQEYLNALQDGADIQVEMLNAVKELTGAMKDLAEGGLLEGSALSFEMPEGGEIGKEFAGFGGFSEGFNSVKEEVRVWFEGLPGNISTWLELAKTTIVQKWEEIKTSVRTTLLMLFAIVLGVFLQIYEKVKTTLLQIAGIVTGGFLIVYNNVKTTLLQIVAIICFWFYQAYLGVSQLVSDIATTLSDTWEEVKTAVSDAWEEVKTTIGTKIEEAYNTLTGWVDSFSQVGTDIIDGFLGGLKDAWEGVKEWFTNRLGDLPQWAKDALGIHSPSTVFAEIGRNLAAGLQAGFDLTNVRADMQATLVGDLIPGGMASGIQDNVARTLILQFGELVLPGIRSGRDAEDLMERLQEIADLAGAAGGSLGGVMA